jgi:predicted peptidase
MYRIPLIFLLSLIMHNVMPQQMNTIKAVHTEIAGSMAYTLLRVGDCSDEQQKLPVILFLHGSGERGADNKKQLEVGLPVFLRTIQEYAPGPFYVLAPQCPENQRWVLTDWHAPAHQVADTISRPLGMAMWVLDSVIDAVKNVDSKRLYVTGLSMGGFGTWELLQRYPLKFAAAVPICGGGDTSLAAAIKSIPIWAFHGCKDDVVIPGRSISMVEAIKKHGRRAKISLYDELGHNSWDMAYSEKKMVKWLFSKRRK